MLDSRVNIKEIQGHTLRNCLIQESKSYYLNYLTFENARYHLGLSEYGFNRDRTFPYPNSARIIDNVLFKDLSEDDTFALLQEIHYWCFWNVFKDCGFYYLYNRLEYTYLYNSRQYHVADVATFKHEEDLMAFKLRFGF